MSTAVALIVVAAFMLILPVGLIVGAIGILIVVKSNAKIKREA